MIRLIIAAMIIFISLPGHAAMVCTSFSGVTASSCGAACSGSTAQYVSLSGAQLNPDGGYYCSGGFTDGSYSGPFSNLSCGCSCDSPLEVYSSGSCMPKTCPSGQRLDDAGQCVTTSCPTGTQLTGSVCVPVLNCPAGQHAENGACVADPVTCPASGTSAMASASAFGISGTSSGCTGSMAFGGCGMTCTSGVSSAGKAACTGCTYTGQPSDSSALSASPIPASEKETPTTPDGCLSNGQGYITNSSGITTCLSPTSSPSPVSQTVPTSTKTMTTTNSATNTPTTTTTTTQDTVNSSSTSSTVTRTETTTQPDGSTTTTTTESDRASFCEENPNATVCNDVCVENPDRVECKDLGTPTSSDEIQSKAFGVSSVTLQSFSSNSTCPAPIALPHGASMSFQWSCDMASALRPLILALAWLTAGMIVMGAVKNG